MIERASICFDDAELAQLGAERIVTICADELQRSFGGEVCCIFTCRRDGTNYVMTAEALPVHQQQAA